MLLGLELGTWAEWIAPKSIVRTLFSLGRSVKRLAFCVAPH